MRNEEEEGEGEERGGASLFNKIKILVVFYFFTIKH
jgi:hypothetical protein